MRVYSLYVRNPFQWSSPMSYLAVGIREACDTWHNHEGVVLEIGGKKFLVHAVPPRAVIVDFTEWVNSDPVREFRLVEETPVDSIEETIARTLSMIGEPYDYLSLFVLQPAHMITGRWIGQTSEQAYRRLTCAELRAKALGIPKAYMARPEKTPNHPIK